MVLLYAFVIFCRYLYLIISTVDGMRMKSKKTESDGSERSREHRCIL